MNRKLSTDAFAFYVSLGADRSYLAVADKYGVSKQAVVDTARKEKWQQRLGEIEDTVRQRTDQHLAEDLEAMNVRHLKILRAIQAKALETLKAMPLATAMEGVRSLELAIRQERLIRGEPSDRTEVNVEQIIKREYERWLKPAESDGQSGDKA